MGEDSACKLEVIFFMSRAGAGNSDLQSVCDKLTSMSTPASNPDSARNVFPSPTDNGDSASTDGESAQPSAAGQPTDDDGRRVRRDIAEVSAVELIMTSALHLMSAAAVKCGLAEGDDAEELKDLDEARKIITALAGFVTAAAPEIGGQHAGPLRDGLRSLQLAFREASVIQDAPGKGPGEKFTGAVN